LLTVMAKGSLVVDTTAEMVYLGEIVFFADTVE
jgi:hypothetical protein